MGKNARRAAKASMCAKQLLRAAVFSLTSFALTTTANAQAFDQFDADAADNDKVNSYLMSLLSHYIYLPEVGAEEGQDFIDKFAALFGPLGLTNFKYTTNAVTDVEYVIAENDDAIFVIFRGTEANFSLDALDILLDVFFTQVDGIHSGFQLAALSVIDAIRSELEARLNASPSKKIWLTGHSLGGATASVAAYALETGYTGTSLLGPTFDATEIPVGGVITFGAPRVFWAGDGFVFRNTADEYDELFELNPTQRWANRGDPIPHLPPPVPLILPYQHIGQVNNIMPDGDGCRLDLNSPELVFQNANDLIALFSNYLDSLPTPPEEPDVVALSNSINQLLIQTPNIIIGDHSTRRYAARIFANLDASTRANLPEPPYPEDPQNACDYPPDSTPPTITPVVSGVIGLNGWYTSDVTVSWEATDPDSDVIDTQGCGESYVTMDTTSVTFTCTATSEGGTATESVTVKRDANAPGEVVVVADRDPNPKGWYNAGFTATWSGNDPISGIDSCSQLNYAGPDTAPGLLQGYCTDNAGNQSALIPFIFKYDATVPTATVSADRPPDSNGWYNSPFVATWTGSDNLSGIDACTVATYSGPDTSDATLTGTCRDNAGNESATIPFGFKYDATAPIITIATPVEGADYLRDQRVEVDYVCTDGLSGIASCEGVAPDGGLLATNSFGVGQFSVTAVDQAGNTTTTANNYSVTYALEGFYAPIEMLPAANAINAGRAISARWNLRDASGSLVPNRTDLFHVDWGPRFSCDAGGTATIEPDSEEGGTGLRWDADDQKYVYRVKTQKSDKGSCRLLTLNVVGSSGSATALFQFVR